MRVLFTRLARQELEDAVRYLELEHPGLGRAFKAEVRKAALRIAAYPRAWSAERGDVRRCLLHKFPYKLMYSLEGDAVIPETAQPPQSRHPGNRAAVIRDPHGAWVAHGSSGHPCRPWIPGLRFAPPGMTGEVRELPGSFEVP
jgi:plasmid stabilization system protein ParE